MKDERDSQVLELDEEELIDLEDDELLAQSMSASVLPIDIKMKKAL